MWRFSFLWLFVVLLLPVQTFAATKGISTQAKAEVGQGRRLALVIGNGDYRNAGTLANPPNDAKLIAQALREVGFDLHGGKAQLNLTKDQMLSTIESFGDSIGPNDVALFYYSGHGLQMKGENYLVPVDANIKSEAEVRVKTVEAALLFAKLETARNSLNIVILDACRNNPFARSFRSTTSGLAAVTAPAGTIVAFSTGPGQVAEDGSGGNSTYSRELSHYLREPGLGVEDVFKRVRSSVRASTGANQIPWENTSLTGDFFFVGGERRVESADFERLAREKAELEWQLAEARAQGDARQQVAMANKPKEKPAPAYSDNPLTFTDPTTGMEFVLVKGGCFQMGSNDGKPDEQPAHEVCVDDFYIGKYEITQGEWQKIMGSNPSENTSLFNDRSRYPVENFSWNDAQDYIRRLNQQSSRSYRLPTEAEWEYAARSGGKSEKYAGFSADAELYRYGNFCDNNCPSELYWKNKSQNDGYKITAPVGSFQPNGLGLHDMSGNIFELCSDWYDDKYYVESPQQNPQGPATGSFRVIRGGSWRDDPKYERSTNRVKYAPNLRLDILGLRLVSPVR